MKIGIISVTKSGNEVAKELQKNFDIDLYSKENIDNFNLNEIAKKLMEEYKAIIFISSTGIAVRAIAKYIKSKAKDPGVIVVDSCGKFVISLLSGHLGGANELTLKVSEVLKAVPVITTATDNLGVIAPDIVARDNSLIIDTFKDAKDIAVLLVDKKKVGFIDLKSEISIPKGYSDDIQRVEGLVYVTHNKDFDKAVYKYNKVKMPENIVSLKLIRRDIVLGIGCRKDFDTNSMKDIVTEVLKELNIDERAVNAIGTVEVKKHETAITELSKYLNCDLKIFSLEEIKKVQHNYKGSDFVEKTIGVRAVCEPCVELLGAKLITEKIKINGMTICVGQII